MRARCWRRSDHSYDRVDFSIVRRLVSSCDDEDNLYSKNVFPLKASTLIDLSLPISPDLPVFPGDLSVEVRQIQTLDQDGWDMKRISINSHDGTHVNVPSHAVADGKTLEAFSLENFI